MRAGERREVVTVYRVVETLATSGGQSRRLQPVATERASVRPLNGRELIAQAAGGAQAEYELMLTYPTSTAITEKDVLEWRGIKLDITSVEPVVGITQHTIIRAKRGAAHRN